MSTTSPFTHRVLHPENPSELVAQAQLMLRSDIVDRFVLIGHREFRRADLMTSCPLSVLRDSPDPVTQVAMYLDILRSHGATGAFAMVVTKDGRTTPESEGYTDPEDAWFAALTAECEDAVRSGQSREPLPGIALAVAALRAARSCEPDGFDIPEVWLIARGEAQPVDLFAAMSDGQVDDGDLCLALGPREPLIPLEETLAASQAVAAGERLPVTRSTRRRRLDRVRAHISKQWAAHQRPTDAVTAHGRTQIAPAQWRDVTGHLAAVRAGRDLGEAEWTDVMRVLQHIGQRDGFESLVESMIRHGNDVAAPGEELIPHIVHNSALRPHPDVRPGGNWHEGVEDLLVLMQMLEQDSRLQHLHGQMGDAVTNLHLLLAVLEWWFHRFATAGDHADAALQRQPHRMFAQCFVEMTSAPLTPAWHPASETQH